MLQLNEEDGDEDPATAGLQDPAGTAGLELEDSGTAPPPRPEPRSTHGKKKVHVVCAMLPELKYCTWCEVEEIFLQNE